MELSMPLKPQQQNQTVTYNIRNLQAPVIFGRPLTILTHLVEWLPILRKLTMTFNHMHSLRNKQFEEAPIFLPAAAPQFHELELQRQSDQESLNIDTLCKSYPASDEPDQFIGALDYQRAYLNAETDPRTVAESLLKQIKLSNQGSEPLNAIIAFHEEALFIEAEESAKRYAKGQPLSALDGVPITVKAEFRVNGLPSTVGTSFLENSQGEQEATIISRLRRAGALILGICNMHEIGLGVTGANVHHGVVRNPYDMKRHSGGSSSGSAAAVAAGLSPISIGTDGGGSIRIPASLCGLVGLKASFGRLSAYGAFPSCKSVCQEGIISTNAIDCALSYYHMAGADELDMTSLNQPHPSLRHITRIDDLSDLKAGIFSPWFDDADPEIVSICRSFLQSLQARGLQIEEIAIPQLEEIRIAHFNTIGAEIYSAMKPYLASHRSELSYPTRIRLALSSETSSLDYIQAQRVRGQAMKNLEKIFAKVDFIVTPSSGITAPLIHQESLKTDELHNLQMGQLMRFSQLHNLTGIPSISMPAGYTTQGLPVGIQFASRWWAEAELLRIAHAADHSIKKKRPINYFRTTAEK